ncbi:DinB family protein [Agaribacterium haliotis]|uniref:DinB family protein n=1 Tax=Agaribacterium haliotis TaxID=2013869 RepID=UPI000BB53FB8|nr:DinB family protein [Agaribacterium haliotis]
MYANRLRLLAQYNQDMNASFYALADKLSDAQRRQDKGAFFSSVHATLNHLLVGDLLWLKRFAKHEARFDALELLESWPQPQALNQILYIDFAELSRRRKQLDAIIVAFAAELSDAHCRVPLAYINVAGHKVRKNFGDLVLHLFNHQSHHRGQLSVLFSLFELDYGATDLVLCIDDI